MRTILLMGLFFFVSCQSEKKPEDVLKSYIDYRFSKKQTRSGVLEKTTGAIASYIKRMTEDEFSFFVNEMKNFKKKKLKINHLKCSDEKCFITYTLNYTYEGFDLNEVPTGKEGSSQVVGIVNETYDSGEANNFSLVRSGKRSHDGIEVKKIAELDRSDADKEWKVSQVSSIKTYIINKEDLN